MNTVYIREMYPDDVDEVLEIESRSFTMPWSDTSFRSEIYSRHSITKVAESNGVIAGYICVKHIADEGHLLDLAVHPDHRKCGIARMLLTGVIEELRSRGCRFFYLEVRISNYAAKKLYKSIGFRTVGTRKGYYINPVEDAVLMMLEL